MSMDLNQDISVVIPARNAADTLRATIESIIGQHNLLEIIVVDDGSKDGTQAVCRGFPTDLVRMIATPGLGIARALNAGFAAARGCFIARCDADDLYLPERLERQHAWLCQRPDHSAVSSGYRTITESGQPVADLACDGAGRDVTPALKEGRAVTSFCTWLTRADALRACGGARPWFITGEDLDLQFRLAEWGRVWHEPVVGYAYRLRERSVTHTISRDLNVFYAAQATVFAQQRALRGTDDLAEGHPPAPLTRIAGAGIRNSAAVHIADQLEGRAWQVFGRQGLRHALPLMLRSVSHAPADRTKWRGLGVMMLKGAFRQGGQADDRG